MLNDPSTKDTSIKRTSLLVPMVSVIEGGVPYCIIGNYNPLYSSWYHGPISRQTSYDRLQTMREPGAYLVRDSANQPGDYAIAYLSHMKQIHHFKINSVCGDFYIGGRQFSSLVELIGYYTNCSCILENENLEVPVMPPNVCCEYLYCLFFNSCC